MSPKALFNLIMYQPAVAALVWPHLDKHIPVAGIDFTDNLKTFFVRAAGEGGRVSFKELKELDEIRDLPAQHLRIAEQTDEEFIGVSDCRSFTVFFVPNDEVRGTGRPDNLWSAHICLPAESKKEIKISSVVEMIRAGTYEMLEHCVLQGRFPIAPWQKERGCKVVAIVVRSYRSRAHVPITPLVLPVDPKEQNTEGPLSDEEAGKILGDVDQRRHTYDSTTETDAYLDCGFFWGVELWKLNEIVSREE